MGSPSNAGGKANSFVNKTKLVAGGFSNAPGSGLKKAGDFGGGMELVARLACGTASGRTTLGTADVLPVSGLNTVGGKGGLLVVMN